MGKDKRPSESAAGSDSEIDDHHKVTARTGGLSRRELLAATTTGAAAGALATSGLVGALAAQPAPATPNSQSNSNGGRSIVLKGGVVLTMDPQKGDLAKADVLISGSKIQAIGQNLGGGEVIDCTGMVVMPGFINTHHHQYETLQRGVIPDGLLRGDWPVESYGSVVQNIWTTGRIIPTGQTAPIWDLGRSPYDPEDCYISELVACVADINAGVTTGIDTSQSSHTPQHTDAMIKGLMDSGRRSLYVYSAGRSDQPGYEYPGSIGNEDSGLGRLRKQWFSSNDQLVTLGFSGGPTLWPLARAFGAQIVNHDFNGANLVANPSQVGPDMVSIHAVDFTEQAWQLAAQKHVHISIAGAIEMQMAHGTPPFQPALEHGILPSLSSDVDTNMTASMFELMRTAFTLQRVLVNPNATHTYPPYTGKPTVSCHQVLEMATVAGAAAAGLSNKVGMLKAGMEADVIVLNSRAINTHPMVNAPGTVVTMMDTSNVDTVIIAGKIMKRGGKLVGVNVEKLLKDIELAQERVLARIHSKPIPVDGLHSAPGYTPQTLGSCCQAVESYNATP